MKRIKCIKCGSKRYEIYFQTLETLGVRARSCDDCNEINIYKERKCIHCGEIKEEKDFHKKDKKKGSLHSKCKTCKNKESKKYRKKNFLIAKKEFDMNKEKNKSEKK